MGKPMFPELETKPDIRNLVGLKIVEVSTSLRGRVKRFQTMDPNGELHDLTFVPKGSAYIAVELDGDEIANIEREA